EITSFKRQPMGRMTPNSASDAPFAGSASPADEDHDGVAASTSDHHDGFEPRRYPITFDPSLIDPDVRKVVKRLTRHGYEAYLVGGCVRDLLLARQPKDFDVA